MVQQRDEDEARRALFDAISAVLMPLARLAVARGVPYPTIDELVRRCFVTAAQAVQPDPSAARIVSRVSAATGLTRREVTRLLNAVPASTTPGRSIASEVFARWTTSPAYRDRRGQPKALPRSGVGPTFERLAQSITRDVHPRSLLDELVRLGVAEHDVDRDIVRLRRDAFVPGRDLTRMLDFLGDNVGDHLGAAVDNVVQGGTRHFEQAIFADALTPESMVEVRRLIASHWHTMVEQLVPRLSALIEADAATPHPDLRRVRIGLYSFDDVVDASSAPVTPPRPPARTRRRRTKESK